MPFDPLGAIQAAREMHDLADDALAKADKLADKVENLIHVARADLTSLVNNIVDRFECEIHFKIKPARPIVPNPAPE